jgi:hypothetical protein
MRTKLILLFICLFWCIPITPSVALDAPSSLGHQLKPEVLIARKLNIVVANFESLGMEFLDRLGGNDFGGAQIEISSVLQGSLSGRVVATYFVGADEAEPKLNTNYIMFIKRGAGGELIIQKLLAAKSDNLAKIKALIAAPTASK